jgi:glycosyltransferase involved in cell wall biosynthesis
MRILIIHEIDWVNKVPFEPHHLAEIFSLKGHEIFVIDCPEPSSNLKDGFSVRTIKKFYRLYDNASITLIHPPSLLIKGLNRISYFLSCKKTIKQTLIENKIDVVLLYGIATNGIQTIDAAKEVGIPVLFRSLDVAHKLVKIPIVRNQVKKYEKMVIKQADKVLATTPELVKYTQEMGSEKSSYFPLGITSKFFKPMQKSSNILNKLNLKNSDHVIGFIGTIYDFAGLDNIITQLPEIIKKIPDLKLIIIGGGPYFENLKSLVHKLNLKNYVVMTGFVDQKNLSEYISLFDLCLNPFIVNSITDRIIPTKILEYMACKKPVLSTPLHGTIELLPDENYGIIYSDLANFTNSIIDLLSNVEKLDKLAESGFNHVQKNHLWDILCDDLLLIFNEMISEKK